LGNSRPTHGHRSCSVNRPESLEWSYAVCIRQNRSFGLGWNGDCRLHRPRTEDNADMHVLVQ
jgi:hypothetical protein